MSLLKEKIKTMIDNLPDDSTLEDIQYHLYVFKKIQNGINSINNNPILHEIAISNMQKWL